MILIILIKLKNLFNNNNINNIIIIINKAKANTSNSNNHLDSNHKSNKLLSKLLTSCQIMKTRFCMNTYSGGSRVCMFKVLVLETHHKQCFSPTKKASIV